jgi:hypothetical protein
VQRVICCIPAGFSVLLVASRKNLEERRVGVWILCISYSSQVLVELGFCCSLCLPKGGRTRGIGTGVPELVWSPLCLGEMLVLLLLQGSKCILRRRYLYGSMMLEKYTQLDCLGHQPEQRGPYCSLLDSIEIQQY